MGDRWDQPHVRRGKELELIVLDRPLCYNILEGVSKPGETNPFWGRVHTPETKNKIREALTGKPNAKLGRKLSIKGVFYPSLAEASRQTGISRKTIRQKLNQLKDPNWQAVDESGKVERPSQRE